MQEAQSSSTTCMDLSARRRGIELQQARHYTETDLALNTRLADTIYWAEPAWPGAHGRRTQTILTRPSTTTAATHARGTLLKRLASCFMVFCSSFM